MFLLFGTHKHNKLSWFRISEVAERIESSELWTWISPKVNILSVVIKTPTKNCKFNSQKTVEPHKITSDYSFLRVPIGQ